MLNAFLNPRHYLNEYIVKQREAYLLSPALMSDYSWSNKRRKRTEESRGASVLFTGSLTVSGNMTEFDSHAPWPPIENAPAKTLANPKPAR